MDQHADSNEFAAPPLAPGLVGESNEDPRTRVGAPSLPDAAALFESVPDAILLVSRDGGIESVNGQAARLFGYAREELIGQEIEMLLPERFRQRHIGHRLGYQAEPRPRPMGADLELYGRRSDGTEFPVDIMLSPMEVARGTVVLAVIRDITERKKAEVAIREREAMFQGLFEHSPDAVVVVDAEGTIGGVNAQLERLFGYSRHDLVGQPVEVLLPERFRERHVGHRQGYLGESRTRPMGAGLELYGRRSTGAEFPVDIMLSPMELGGKTLALGVIRDITERKEAEEALRESQGMFQGLFEHAPDPIVVVDSGGQIVRVNAQLELLFGYSRDELLTQPIELLLPERYRARHISHRTAYASQPRTRSMGAGLELYGRRRNGTEFPVDIMLSPLETKEGRLALAVIRDITERKEEERRRDVLLREIHHRVKNNLQVVSSMLSLQSEYIRDDTLLSIVMESQNRIRSIALIHEKLYRSSSLGSVDFSDYVQDLCSNLFHSYGSGASNVKLHLGVEGVSLNLDTAVPCGLIINELVSNCLKHAFFDGRQGEITVDLRSADGRFVLNVRDNGVGFPEDLDFRRTDSLGLQLVNILTSQLDGSIALHRGEGTRFEITFAEMSYTERA